MENKKFEQLIELIINENEEQAKELFHDIVVEKSREIYENIMAEEEMEESMHDMEEGHPAGQVTDLIDEISAEETSMSEADDDIDAEFDDEAEEAGDDLTHDMEADHDEEGDAEEGDAEDLEDRVVDIEDKLDMLMAKFEEEIMGLGGEEVEVTGDEVMAEGDDNDGEEGEEEGVMEAVQLQKVSVTHGDDGANKKSVALTSPKIKAEGVKPVKFSGQSETVPTGPKGPSNEYSKKEGTLIGDVGNSPGQKKGPTLKAAPKPVTKDGAADKHSPVAKG